MLRLNNEWLEEQGLYKSETHWLNEKKLKEVVRVANQIVDRSKAYKRIDELIRDTATKTKTIDLTEVQGVSQLFERALHYLPK